MISHSERVNGGEEFSLWIKRNLNNLVKYCLNAFYLVSSERDQDKMLSILSVDRVQVVKTMELKASYLSEKALQRLMASSPDFPCHPLMFLDGIILDLYSALHPGVEYETTQFGRFIKAFCEDAFYYIGPRIAMLRYLYGCDSGLVYSLLNEEGTNIDRAYYRWKRDCETGGNGKYQLSGFNKEDIRQVIREIEDIPNGELIRIIDHIQQFYGECSLLHTMDCVNSPLTEDEKIKMCRKRYQQNLNYEYRTWCLSFNRGCLCRIVNISGINKGEFSSEIRLKETLTQWLMAGK